MKDINLLIGNGVNINESLELFGDIATYNETLEDFLSAIDEKIAKMKIYKEAADMNNYAILVHSLKSDAKYFGFTKLAEMAFQHETESKANNSGYVYEYFNSLMEETKRILNLVRTYLGKPPIVEEKNETVILKDKTILVVDDSNIIKHFINKIFNDDYNILLASDGKEALEIIEKNQNHKIVAILLDLNMPNFNGFDFLDYFMAKNLFTSIPISIITGESNQETIRRAASYPIVDMLMKPFNERDVKRVVEKTIENVKMI